MSSPRPAADRRAASLAALALAALALAACTDPVGVRQLPGDDAETAVRLGPACEEFAAEARSHALLAGLHEYCYSPSLQPVVWDPLLPAPAGLACSCRAVND